MNREILNEILNDYEKKRDKALYSQRIRQKKAYLKVPELEKLDVEISNTGFLISKAILENPDCYEEKAREIKEKMEKLKMKKALLLTENNIPLEYLDVVYECDKCQDTGFLSNGVKCSCLKQEMISRIYKMSNIEDVLKKENFQTFDINVFPDTPFENEKLTPRENMRNIAGIAEGFVYNFNEKNGENLLFYGSTGLGKTFMCNCIAKGLIDKNKMVIYQTAFKILEIIESHRFRRNERLFDDMDYEILFTSDLLIIDDLGTEVANTFTNAEIFNIVNTRILNGSKTIISTNLTPKEISETYTDRVFSRVLDKFIPLKFYGPDLRWER